MFSLARSYFTAALNVLLLHPFLVQHWIQKDSPSLNWLNKKKNTQSYISRYLGCHGCTGLLLRLEYQVMIWLASLLYIRQRKSFKHSFYEEETLWVYFILFHVFFLYILFLPTSSKLLAELQPPKPFSYENSAFSIGCLEAHRIISCSLNCVQISIQVSFFYAPPFCL